MGSRRPARRLLPVIGAVFWAGAVADAALSPGDTLQYRDEKLTVRLHGTTPDDALAELARLAGAKVVGGVKDPKPLVAEFDAVPINEALYRLLGNQNFTLIFGRRGNLSTIRLHGGPLTATVTPAAPGPPPVAPGAPAPASLVGLIENHAPIPLSGPLSQVLGTTSASFRQLFEVATRNDAAPLRSEALRLMLNTIDTDPELRTQFITTLKSVDDATVGQFVKGAAGDRAEEFLIHAATQSRGSEMRVKASAVLQQLRTQAPGG